MNQRAPSGIIAWFACNPVAANLLMLVIFAVGIGSAFNLQRAMLPAFEINRIVINVPYPGAAPEEVELGVILKIEEAINDLDGIKRIEADAFESFGRMIVEPDKDVDVTKLTADIRGRIDGIAHFPGEAERPIVSQPEILMPALTIQISGDLDERSMKSLADQIRRDLLTYEEVSAAEVVGARDYEIAIEISEQLLREYHLTLGDVARRISASSLDPEARYRPAMAILCCVLLARPTCSKISNRLFSKPGPMVPASCWVISPALTMALSMPRDSPCLTASTLWG